MLRLHTAYSADGVKKYFEAADYYTEGQEIVGQWGGKLAEQLGLFGRVDKRTFDLLCDNRRPDGSKLTMRTREGRRVGDDMIFSLPKDVGAAIMLAPPDLRDALLAMAGDRADQVMRVIEADIAARIRKNGMDADRVTGNLLWAGFLHTTARPVDGQVPDPHPHWHKFAFNATQDPVEGRIKAIQTETIYRDRSYYEALFFSLVAKDLADLGQALERRDGGKWGLAGLPATFATKFSKRTGEIEDEAKRLNVTDPARKSELGAKTRSRKQKELTPEELRGSWQDQLSDDEREALARIYAKQVAQAAEVTAQEAVAFAIDHCSEKLSVIPERELIRVALLHGVGCVTQEQVLAELPRQGVIIREIDGRRMATTPKLQAEERDISGYAAAGLGSVRSVGVDEGLSRVMAGGKTLNDGQWESVCGLLESENRVNLVEGPAGAGKSSMLAKYDEGMRRAGQSVTYLATSSDAVEVLAKEGFEANTVARFLLDRRMQAAAKGGRVVIDETSMLGHKSAHRLFELAEKLDLKLIMVGDPMQHGSVDRGATMRLIKEYGGVAPFSLKEIMRQINADDARYLAAAKQFSEGKTAEGFETLDSMGWIREIEDSDRRYQEIAAEYLEAVTARESIVVVSPTHREAASITDAIRSLLREKGRLGTEEHAVTRLVPIDTSEPERGQARNFLPGQVLIFHQNAKGFTKGDRLTVTEPVAVPVSESAQFAVYRPETVKLAAGDVLRFTGTVKTLDGEHTLRNGSTRTVAGFTAKGIRLDNGWVVGKDAGLWRLGFVDTSFSAQGKTVKRAILSMSALSTGAMNQEQMYVSASRALKRMTVYTDDKDVARWAIQRSSKKLLALDLEPAPRATVLPMDRARWYLDQKRRLATLSRTRASYAQSPQPTPKQPEREVSHARYR